MSPLAKCKGWGGRVHEGNIRLLSLQGRGLWCVLVCLCVVGTKLYALACPATCPGPRIEMTSVRRGKGGNLQVCKPARGGLVLQTVAALRSC